MPTLKRLCLIVAACLCLGMVAAPAQTAYAQTSTVLRQGSTGPAVANLQNKLAQIGFLPGAADGHYGAQTYQAVMSFQKYQRLSRDGIAGPQTLGALASVSGIAVPSHCNGAQVCVDIARQVVFLHTAYGVKVIGTSTGGWYYKDGQTRYAETPRGTFSVFRKVAGYDYSPNGDMWYSSYFMGGNAFHGSNGVGPQPGSMGCVRIPRHLEQLVFNNLPVGSKVVIF